MLGAALGSTGHGRHQLLAATWRSISHFPAERTRNRTSGVECRRNVTRHRLARSLARWLPAGRSRVYRILLVRVPRGFTLLRSASLRLAPLCSLSVVSLARAYTTPPPCPKKISLRPPAAAVNRAAPKPRGTVPHVRSRRSARRTTRGKKRGVDLDSYRAAHRRPLHLLKIRQEVPCVPENSNMRSAIVGRRRPSVGGAARAPQVAAASRDQLFHACSPVAARRASRPIAAAVACLPTAARRRPRPMTRGRSRRRDRCARAIALTMEDGATRALDR